jgi:hypothetical protein
MSSVVMQNVSKLNSAMPKGALLVYTETGAVFLVLPDHRVMNYDYAVYYVIMRAFCVSSVQVH